MNRASLLAALLLAAAATPAVADVDVSVRLGHDGRWIHGASTPVAVDLRNSGSEPIAVDLELGQTGLLGAGSVRHRRRVFLPASGSRREYFLIPGPAGWQGRDELTVMTSPRVPVHSRGRSASRGRMTLEIVGGAGSSDRALDAAARVAGVLFDERGVFATRLPEAVRELIAGRDIPATQVEAVNVDPRVLSLGPLALDGLDSLIVVDPDAAFCVDPGDLDGLLDWVALGGDLVISPGPNAPGLLASPLARHLPAVWGAAREAAYADLVQAVHRQSYEKAVLPPSPFAGPWLDLRARAAWTLDPPATDPGPLYLDRRLGLGRIRVLAFDARRAVGMAHHRQQVEALATLLTGRGSPLRGFDDIDLITNLQWGNTFPVDKSLAAVLREDAFEPPPLPLVLLGLGLYVLVVGPVDWFVLKRMKKERLTTLTFAAAVAGFTTLAYGASFLVFSTDEVANRVTLVDLADGGRDGRQLIRVQDLAGYYSPRGVDRSLEFSLPTVILPGQFPGSTTTSEVGTSLPVTVSGPDAVTPRAEVQVAFRSQRIVRAVMAGATGRTIDVEWADAHSAPRRLRVVNGLPVALESVSVIVPGEGTFRLGDLAPGAEITTDFAPVRARPGREWETGRVAALGREPEPDQVRGLLALLSRSSADGIDGRMPQRAEERHFELDRQAAFEKFGIGRGRALRERRALLIAFANEVPVPMPGADADGHTYVVIRKEIDLP